ncbi:MAG: acyltransferase [Clostridiales bacterium]|nr:acyltransferase [Clostridiales bacterium]
MTRNHSIDVMRILMAFLVVTIHWPFEGRAGQVFITYGKTAVPFFFAVCGYFLFREDTDEMMKRLKKQAKRIGILYIAAKAFYGAYLAIYLRISEGSFKGMKEFFTPEAVKELLLYNFSPFSEHLWFLGSLLYALLIMMLLNKLKILKPALFAGPVLIASYVILSHLEIGSPVQLRNAILVGMGYTMTGMLVSRYKEKILDIKYLKPVLWISCAVLAYTAIVELNTYKQGTGVPFISCEFLTFVMLLLCLKYPDIGKDTFAEKLGRDCSLPIYIMHIFVMHLMAVTGNDGFFGRFPPVCIFVITAFFAYLYSNIKKAIIRN